MVICLLFFQFFDLRRGWSGQTPCSEGCELRRAARADAREPSSRLPKRAVINLMLLLLTRQAKNEAYQRIEMVISQPKTLCIRQTTFRVLAQRTDVPGGRGAEGPMLKPTDNEIQ